MAAGAGLSLCALALLWSDPAQLFRSYLVAYQFWLGVSLGSLAILMLQYLTGGAWGLFLRRPLEAAIATLPLMALLFVPLLFGLRVLYPWARLQLPEGWVNALESVGLLGPYCMLWEAHSGADELMREKQLYLNIPFFLLRALVYFSIWLTLAHFLLRWSWRQDETGDLRLSRKFRLLSAPGLVLYGLTITFTSIDWAMSLEPHWFSTVYGLLYGAGQVLAAFAVAIGVTVALARRPPESTLAGPLHLRDLGNLLLAFVMIWAYLSFSQFLLIWSANLPEEIPWYLERLHGGWGYAAMALVLFHFFLPFFLLLSRDVKESSRRLIAVAGLILLMRYVDFYWLIAPGFGTQSAVPHAMDLAATVGLGGLWTAWYVRTLRRRPLLPLRDPYLREALAHD